MSPKKLRDEVFPGRVLTLNKRIHVSAAAPLGIGMRQY
jgi:hypothetical protein